MRATVYTVPDEVGQPPNIFDYLEDRKKFNELDKAWHAKLKKWCIDRNPTEYVGEIIRFQVADGYAEYMVASLISPVEVIHLPTVDAYQCSEINYMHGKDIKAKIDSEKKFEAYLDTLRKDK